MKKINLALIVLLLTSIVAMGQDSQAGYRSSDEMKDWGFSVTPYAMLAAQSTDVGTEKIRQSFSDLTGMTNAGFQIIAVARYKRLKLSFDGTFATLGSDMEQGPLTVEVEIKQRILDYKLSYIVYDNFEFAEDNAIHGWSLEFGVGAKYWKNDVGVNYEIAILDTVLGDGLTIPQEWWDLMVGVKTHFVLNKKVSLGVALDVGGFGIGNSSKFAYNFTYINNFKVLNWMSVNAGFRNFRYNRIDDEVETTVNVLGPLIGVSFIF